MSPNVMMSEAMEGAIPASASAITRKERVFGIHHAGVVGRVILGQRPSLRIVERM